MLPRGARLRMSRKSRPVAAASAVVVQKRNVSSSKLKKVPLTLGAKQNSAIEKQRTQLTFGSTISPTVHSLPDKAKIVIVGGGAQGSAIAYKLAQRGLGPDTVVIDQGDIGSGSTWHSAGLISQLATTRVETKLSRLSRELYLELEQKNYFTGWKQVGSLHVAQTKDRLHHFRRLVSEADCHQVQCEIVDPDRARELCPIIRTDDILGALWVPGDGVANPYEICRALTALSSEMGVRYVDHCNVENVLVRHGAVFGVQTNKGTVECDKFVNSAGYWARRVGFGSNPRVNVPLRPAGHYYLHTKPSADLIPSTPVVHDPDAGVYFRENEGRFLAGGFEPMAKDIFSDGRLPRTGSHGGEFPVDWDHFHVLLEGLLNRVPSMGNAVLDNLTNGPEAFSPDGNWILGHAPEVKNYYVATAMRSIGIGAAGGVGEAIASYIIDGKPPFDMHNLDIQRFLPAHNNRKFLRDRITEVPGRFYAIPYSFPEFKTGRALRTSPIFPKLREAGARFNQVMGYERAMYFKKDAEPTDMSYFGMHGLDVVAPAKHVDKQAADETSSLIMAETPSFYKPPWFNEVQEEFIATRHNVTVADYSSFAKFDIWSSGTEVVDFLQYMCSNDIDVPVGSIVHTGMHNEDGGFENDCSIARLAFNRFMLMSPSIQQMRSFTWMKHHLPADNSVFLQDVTFLYTTLCIMGPKSPDVMGQLTDIDLTTFNYFTCRHMDVACAPDILAMNMTHTGEMGYIMHIPSEFALHVFDAIMEAGKDHGIRHCGYYAMHALRIEKFYAFWGQDLDSQTTPYECGRSVRVKMENENNVNKDLDFIGRKAFELQKQTGIKKILVMLLLDTADHDVDSDPWPWGGEPIYRDGKYCGSVTTSAYGFTINRHVCLGFIHNFDDDRNELNVTADYVKSADYEIEIAGHRYPVDVKLNAPVLPTVRLSRRQSEAPTRYNEVNMDDDD